VHISCAHFSQRQVSVLSKKRILVVDDDEISRLAACEILGNLGAETESAATAQVAIHLASNTSYDMILLDLHMPGMSGIELSRALISMVPDLEEKIVFLSSAEVHTPMNALARETSHRVLSKPLDPEQILQHFRHSPVSVTTGKPETSTHPHVEGIDIASGIRNFMGQDKAFFHTLRAFPEYGERYIEECKSNIEKNNLKECWRLAHSLKGSSSMIGAYELNALARQLEYSCSKADDKEATQELFEKIVKQIRKMNSSIHIAIKKGIYQES
jgi:CheY-like chemotaxis protein/HPt (histidine-containing phosphotransfer) domain-containing protein